MNLLFNLENTYLKAKVDYYNGTPTLSDSEFDSLELLLKKHNSKVVNQVGYKSKDFNFTHPTKMLSLSKIQTEMDEEGQTNYMFDIFSQWYNKRIPSVGRPILISSPKFDGNAINLIYVGNKFTSVITRGDGITGKDVTDALKNKFPQIINSNINLKNEDTLEIRCEVVIDKYLFNDKYSKEFSNPRNYVAGVIGADDFDTVKVSELDCIPLHFILNGKHVSIDDFMDNEFVSNFRYDYIRYDIIDGDYNYIDIIKEYENLRESFKYQLDGVVFAYPTEYRERLGQNSHDPEWSVAIKFVPEDGVSAYNGLEFNVGKTGELSPVILIEPLQLVGTIVRRVSGYNLGYIINNGIGIGSLLSIQKAGDIIPEVKKVVLPSDDFSDIPTVCPSCGTTLRIDGIHLMCDNELCPGRIGKQLATNAKFIDIKGIGPKTMDNFSSDFEDLIDLIHWVKTNGHTKEIENYGISFNSRSHELFLNAFNNIKSLTFGQAIVIMGFNNVGLKLADQVANMYFNNDPDFSGHDKSIVSMFNTEEVKDKIKLKVDKLISCGIEVTPPIKKDDIVVSEDTIYVCMTGSPKLFGFATKEVFMKEFNGKLIDVSLTDKNCMYLITDDYNSTSSKMKTATKKGIEIITYNDFYDKIK